MRLFIAIQLSEEIKKKLVGVLHDLKKQGVEGNYVPAQNLDGDAGVYRRIRRSGGGEGSYRKSSSAGIPAEPVGDGEFRKHSLGGDKRQSEAENICEKTELGAGCGWNSL